MSKKILFTTTAILILTLLISCNRRIGSGVVLWSNDESLIESGTIVQIYEESKIRQTYSIAPIDSKERVEMEQWRVQFFDTMQDTKKYAENYSPYFKSFAYSERQGLPIREAETSDSTRVYKLKEGQEIKVIGRADESVKVGNLGMGYWYHVLTEDGISGYVFDAVLTVYSMNESERVIINAKEKLDPLLDNFLDNVWRPSYFNDMITKNIIDLSSFKDIYGLKIDREKKEITLRLQNKNITETYSNITRFGTKRYDFAGTSFRVTVVSESVASVLYKDNGKDINEVFVNLDVNIGDIISKELTRRNNLLKELIEHSSVFTSAAYGSISLIDESERFIWNGIERLVSRNIISPSSEPQGTIEFNHFPNTLIKNIYRGVITFNFRNGSEANFLYSYTDSGVSLLFVPDRYIKNLIITTDQFFDPIQIFFEFDSSPPSTGSGIVSSDSKNKTGEGS